MRSLLSAGVDTTINGLGNVLYALANHPAQYERLTADLSLARPAFDEGLRWESTVQTVFRTAARDSEIAGVPVPENSKVLCLLASANRDPRKWPDPERFDITRRPRGHVAFDTGIHGCVGQAVARLEGEVVLGQARQANRSRRRTYAPPQQHAARAGHVAAAFHSCLNLEATMPDITFILPDRSPREIDAAVGISVMQVATGSGLPGIVAECGGSAMCATCHVYVDPAWADRLPAPLGNELEMFECTAADRLPTSRLSCQIKVVPSLHGLVVRIPECQQ